MAAMQTQDAASGPIVRRDAWKTAEQASSSTEASPAADVVQVWHPINPVQCVSRTPSFAGIHFASLPLRNFTDAKNQN